MSHTRLVGSTRGPQDPIHNKLPCLLLQAALPPVSALAPGAIRSGGTVGTCEAQGVPQSSSGALSAGALPRSAPTPGWVLDGHGHTGCRLARKVPGQPAGGPSPRGGGERVTRKETVGAVLQSLAATPTESAGCPSAGARASLLGEPTGSTPGESAFIREMNNALKSASVTVNSVRQLVGTAVRRIRVLLEACSSVRLPSTIRRNTRGPRPICERPYGKDRGSFKEGILPELCLQTPSATPAPPGGSACQRDLQISDAGDLLAPQSREPTPELLSVSVSVYVPPPENSLLK